MKREEDEQLWDLLGQARTPQISPFFVRNIMREIRQEPRWKGFVRSWLAPRRLVPAAGVAAAVIAGVMIIQHPAPHRQPPVGDLDPIAKIDPQDYEVVADLDDLMASEENNLWDDTSSL
jgi:hypothetical protein